MTLPAMANMMGKATFVIRGDKDLTDTQAFIGNLDRKKLWEIKIGPHTKARSLAQNRLSFLWYGEIGAYMGIVADEARCRCKLKFGVPIMVAEDEFFARTWQQLVEKHGRTFLLDLMELVPVTSLMTVAQMSQYLTDIDFYFGSQGLDLTHPEDLYPLAMGQYDEENGEKAPE